MLSTAKSANIEFRPVVQLFRCRLIMQRCIGLSAYCRAL